jgi:dGTPase
LLPSLPSLPYTFVVPDTDRIHQWNSLLAAAAVPFGITLGRMLDEPEDDMRFPFQRDRGRIIHSPAFRRLQGKTQVFVSGEGDHYRTRLTHTMEVAQISRDVARALRLNEDLAECIALAHDLGHPPFGHAGEAALDAWMRTRPDGQAGFEHNLQSYRIVTLLEPHAAGAPGLNLNREVLFGLLKHASPDQALLMGTNGFRVTLEARLVDLADRIAYTGSDVDDGLRAGLFSRADLAALPLAAEAATRSQLRGTYIRGAIIDALVRDVVDQVSAFVDDPTATADVIRHSPAIARQLADIQSFLREKMYSHPRVVTGTADGQAIIAKLCEQMAASPNSKVLDIQRLTGSSLTDAVKDYVAGMTDAFARKALNEG